MRSTPQGRSRTKDSLCLGPLSLNFKHFLTRPYEGRTPRIKWPLNPQLQVLNGFYLLVVTGMKIPLGGPNVRMAHQRLDGFEITAVVQESRGEGMADYMGMNPFSNQSFFRHRFDEAINCLW